MKVSVKLGVLMLAAATLIGTSAIGDESGVKRSLAQYTVPQVQLVRDDGKHVTLQDELKDGRPAVLTFVFTSCTTICPLISQTLSNLQDQLGPNSDRVHIISISIDPEGDTPAQLAEYAKKLHAGPEWHHYTGTVQAITATEKAFNAYRGDKMSHTPVILLRPALDQEWVRFDGFPTAGQLLNEIRSQVASR